MGDWESSWLWGASWRGLWVVFISLQNTSRFLSLVPGPWSLVSGPWSLVLGPWSLIPGPWSLVPGPWSLVPGHLSSIAHDASSSTDGGMEMESFWAHAWVMLGSYRGDVGILLGSCWAHFRSRGGRSEFRGAFYVALFCLIFRHPSFACVPWFLVLGPWPLGPWSLVPGPWSLVPGPWSLVLGPWSLVSGPWSVVPGPWSLVPGP